jgi:hypothetical protein
MWIWSPEIDVPALTPASPDELEKEPLPAMRSFQAITAATGIFQELLGAFCFSNQDLKLRQLGLWLNKWT